MLDVSVRREEQRLGRLARREVLEVLRGERVQPAEPVGAADPHDAAVRQVDRGVARDELPLLAVGVAVVGRDALVGLVGRDRARALQGRAGHDEHAWHRP